VTGGAAFRCTMEVQKLGRSSERSLVQVPVDGLDQCLDVFRVQLAVLSEYESPLLVESQDIALMIRQAPLLHQHLLVVPHVDGLRVALLLFFQCR
jgi:hypothetical protein